MAWCLRKGTGRQGHPDGKNPNWLADDYFGAPPRDGPGGTRYAPWPLMHLVVLLLALVLPEAVPVIVTEANSAVGADTVRARPRLRPEPVDRDRRAQPDRGIRDRNPPREPEARRPPSDQRNKPQPTGDPQLKRRKPPSLNSPRRP